MGECPRDGHPIVDSGYVCHRCADRLAEDLRDLDGIAPEVAVTIARLDRHGDGGHTSAEKPLPFDWDASDADWAAHNTITTWARHVSETRGKPIELAAGHPTVAAARWLAGELGWLRNQPEAEQAWDELHDACALLSRTIDNPGVRWYAGPCHAQPEVPGDGERCEADLYARPGADRVVCATCGTIHDAAARRQWLLDEARDQLLHAGWLAAALSALLGEPVTDAQVRGYAHRGRIVAHGTDQRGRPVYRVGDVLELVERGRIAA